MELVEFGPDEADHLTAFLDVANRARAVDSPWEPVRTAYRQVQYMRHSWEGEPGRWFVAYDGATPVGAAAIDASDYDNLDLAWLRLTVAPGLRRRGHGAAMLHGLEELAAAMDRPLIHLSGWDEPGLHRVATALGYERRSAEIRRLQVVAEAPDLGPIRDAAAAHAQDYELLRVEGSSPDDLLPALVDLTAAINDAPVDDLEWEDEVYSVDRVRAYERAQVESGLRFRRVVARHRPTGELAGHTVVVVDSEQPEIGEQHDTSVVRAHRGHRLGLLMKAEMLLWLAEVEPQLTRIYTDNAESNRHMIAVNEALGYRPVGRTVEFQRRLR
ncbi:GNAT family N-acetyltransferase [Nocardioides pocheonensis]|uniref:GNAT family N-acetyltransferase n=1 Tax=Nocardioides pocheonensis TaxID=661485 RepID=A0A3N0GQ45_9ACTN|nr:GNAT family N-acetyltransferase [Nocardioides pocheonensis]RNM14547.1 GNAT family N-acetyltransferase [Nocardioides pocheonensis]